MGIVTRVRRRLGEAGLTARLTAWYVGLLAVMLVSLGAFLSVGLAQLSTGAVVAAARNMDDRMRRSLLDAVSAGEPLASAARGALNTSPGPPDRLLTVADADGEVIAHTPGPRDLVEVLRPTGVDALRSGTSEWFAVVDGDVNGPLVVGMTQVVDPATGLGVGFVQVTIPVSQSEFAVRWLGVLFALGFGAMILVAAIVGPRLTGLGLRPLLAMAGASRHLASGDLTTRVAVPPSRDEVGDLARAFNDMAEQLETAFAAQQAFIADASHELRAPLHALGGQIDVQLRVMDERPAEARRLAGFMRREVDRLTSLVEDLLVLARVDAQGADALEFETIDLIAVGRDVFEQSRVLPIARGRTITLEVDDARIPVCGDPRRLHQVLLNLMINALQQVQNGGRVMLAIHSRGQLACVEVSDDGPGIAHEHLERVFDRFYRTDAARTRVAGGAGLGLSIAQAIVKAHHGTIAAAVAPIGGALFTVMLPLATL